MYYGTIKNCDIANGLGIRVSLFVSGCRNCCEGCFNQDTWAFNYGQPYTKETEDKIIEMLKPEYIDGFALLGGEPFEEENQIELVELLERIKREYPNKDIWCYTGYILDRDLLPEEGRKHTEVTNRMLNCIDVLVDGPFVLAKKNLMLKFKGSSNQRVIDLKETLKTGQVKIYIE